MSSACSATLSRSHPRDFFRVRWRPASSTTPLLMSISGLIDSMLPSRAWALPIRPPFFRFSRVSMAPKTRVRSRMPSTRVTTSSADAPRAAAWAAACTMTPKPAVTERLSTTRTSPSTSRAASSEDSIVAETPLDRLIQTMASAPSAKRLRKTSWKAPGAGAAVCGRSSLEAIRR